MIWMDVRHVKNIKNWFEFESTNMFQLLCTNVNVNALKIIF